MTSMKLVCTNVGGNLHDVARMVNKMDLANNLIQVHPVTGMSSVVLFRVPEDWQVENGWPVRPTAEPQPAPVYHIEAAKPPPRPIGPPPFTTRLLPASCFTPGQYVLACNVNTADPRSGFAIGIVDGVFGVGDTTAVPNTDWPSLTLEGMCERKYTFAMQVNREQGAHIKTEFLELLKRFHAVNPNGGGPLHPITDSVIGDILNWRPDSNEPA